MASSNKMTLWVAKTSAAGVILPPSAEGYFEIPWSSESLRPSSSSTRSNLVRRDRQPADDIFTGMQVSGAINGQFMHGAYDLLLEAAMFGADFAAVASATTGLTLTVTPGTSTLAGTGAFANMAVGDFIRLEKSGAPNNGKTVRIATKASNDSITYDSGTLTAETGATGYTISPGDRTIAGTQRRDLVVVKEFSDQSKYEVQLGHLADGFTFGVRPNGIVEVSFTLRGRTVVPDFGGAFVLRNSDGAYVKTGGSPGTGETAFDFAAILAGGTAAPANPVMSTVKNATLIVNGVESTILTNFQLQLANNVFGTPVVGVAGDRSINEGGLAISGSFEVLLEGNAYALYQSALNDESAQIALRMQDADRRTYVIDIPKGRLRPQGTQAQGENQDVPLTIEFGGALHSGLSRTIAIQRWAALAA